MYDEDRFTPAYVKIQRYVLSKIESGEYNVGDRLPPETELAQLFSVSRITANKALKELSLTGVIERIKGKGTFVRAVQPPVSSVHAFSAAINLDITGTRYQRLLSHRVTKANKELSEKLCVSIGTPLYEIILSNLNDNHEPIDSLDYCFIPTALVDDLSSLLNHLQSKFVVEYIMDNSPNRPAKLEAYVALPLYEFLQSAHNYLSDTTNINVWSSLIRDQNNNVICSVFNVYTTTSHDTPLFIFSL